MLNAISERSAEPVTALAVIDADCSGAQTCDDGECVEPVNCVAAEDCIDERVLKRCLRRPLSW